MSTTAQPAQASSSLLTQQALIGCVKTATHGCLSHQRSQSLPEAVWPFQLGGVGVSPPHGPLQLAPSEQHHLPGKACHLSLGEGRCTGGGTAAQSGVGACMAGWTDRDGIRTCRHVDSQERPPLATLVRQPVRQPKSRLGIRTELKGVCFYLFGNTPIEPGKLYFFPVFRPEFISVPGAVLGQNGLKNQYFAISCPWGSGRPKQKV